MTLAINKNHEKTKQNKKRMSMKFVYNHFIAPELQLLLLADISKFQRHLIKHEIHKYAGGTVMDFSLTSSNEILLY